MINVILNCFKKLAPGSNKNILIEGVLQILFHLKNIFRKCGNKNQQKVMKSYVLVWDKYYINNNLKSAINNL